MPPSLSVPMSRTTVMYLLVARGELYQGTPCQHMSPSTYMLQSYFFYNFSAVGLICLFMSWLSLDGLMTLSMLVLMCFLLEYSYL